MRIEHWHSAKEKRGRKIVRTDTYADVPGEIDTADESTGECSLIVDGESKTFGFGPHGIKIIWRD